ncbi:MAG: hypothetical protein J7623_11830 [Chitinophaga sp.]|uniref:hypothetical protein n=1 Tax=Chitinophaga sp. TaxID=1869181 RepID=UPI001B14E4F9|nr:hypothetical protein [Chitinophaga sp.]MBO9729317.1 hypothetical protein [Chitinophaga sp.]
MLLPEVPLKENTPGGIRIMGVIEVLFSSLMIVVGITLISLPGNIINDVRAMLPTPEEQKAITPMAIQVAGVFCLIPGLILIINAVLSFGILRKWQERQQHDDHLGE